MLLSLNLSAQNNKGNTQFIDSFNNINHPQVAYWFFSKDMLNEAVWKNKIDSLAANSKYTLIFLTARNGVDFFEPEKMHDIFLGVVHYAHQKGIQIGLQLWGTPKNTSEDASERCVVENESTIDENGSVAIYNKAKHVRAQSGKPFKSALLKAYLFKKTGNGFYDPTSLLDVTNQGKIKVITDSSVSMQFDLSKKYAGYHLYVITQHFYKVSSNHSQEAIDKMVNIMKAYKDIPFDGVGLDEYTNLKLFATWELTKINDHIRERLYSLDMAKKFKEWYHEDLERTFFDMRYAPINHPEKTIKAINTYMDIMRKGTLNVETAMYDHAKSIFGPNTFVGLHDSHHNYLDGDEVWQTGINWWNVKRDYGHTDEATPTPTQMGILYGYKMNMLYNMFYDKSIDKIQEKAYTDLQYNIRTHYHAINDIQNWGVSVEKKGALDKINPVEQCARLLNRFNPAIPKIKLLIVFGREALMDWYPDSTHRGICDINDKLQIEEKAMQVWNAGYLNALVPSDVIEDGRLVVSNNGKAVYNGHVFDAVIYLYPEFAKEKTIQFLEQYTLKGGKLMFEGDASRDFMGADIHQRWKLIRNKAIRTNFDIEHINQLGIIKDNIKHTMLMSDGSYLFSNLENFKNNNSTQFTQNISGNTYEANYIGYAALLTKGNSIQKFAANAFDALKVNGKTVLSLNIPSDIFIENVHQTYQITIANKNAKILINTLNE
jgi:hypothetical protein